MLEATIPYSKTGHNEVRADNVQRSQEFIDWKFLFCDGKISETVAHAFVGLSNTTLSDSQSLPTIQTLEVLKVAAATAIPQVFAQEFLLRSQEEGTRTKSAVDWLVLILEVILFFLQQENDQGIKFLELSWTYEGKELRCEGWGH